MELVQIIESVLSIYYQTFAQKNWEILPTFYLMTLPTFLINAFLPISLDLFIQCLNQIGQFILAIFLI